jgi:hypothetical protein
MRLFAVLFFLGLVCSAEAQEINFNGTAYKVKGDAILKDGADVTNTLSAEEQISIKDALSKQEALNKEREEAEKR